MKSTMKSMTTDKESAKLQKSTEQTNKQESNGKELIKYHEVKDTPFTVVNKEDKEYYVMLGKYRLTEAFNTAEEAVEDAKRADWERVMQVIGVMIEEYKK